MAYFASATAFQDVQKSRQVGVAIGVRIINRITHPGLGGKMGDDVETPGSEQCSQVLARSHVEGQELEIGIRLQTRQSRLLEADVVVGVQIVDTDNLVSANQ